MKCLIVEDDFVSRRVLISLLAPHFEYDIAINGEEAVMAFQLAHQEKKPYDLICMDIMMQGMDGQTALRRIRELEHEMGVPASMEAKAIMTTSLDDPKTVMQAFYTGGAASYLVKPVTKQKLMAELRKLKLI